MRSDWRTYCSIFLIGAISVVGPTRSASAQQAAAPRSSSAPPTVRATPVAASAPIAAPGANEFAPGVLTTIPPALDRDDAISVHDIPEIRADSKLAWEPSSTTK